MKNLILIFFILILAFSNVFSQYNETVTGNSQWYTYSWFESSCNETLQIDGDSIINGTLYHKLIAFPSCEGGFELRAWLREDTLLKKIYRLNLDLTEDVIYDFGLLPGDTFYINQTFMILESITDTIFNPFISNDTLSLNIINPKVFNFNQEVPSAYQTVWVEGIGSLTGLMTNNFTWGGGILGETLLCHYNNNEERDFHYIYDFEESDCKGPIFSSTQDLSEFKINVNVFPNPSSNQFNIKLESADFVISKILIFDLFGRIEDELLINSTEQLVNIAKYSSGILILQIELSNGENVVRKIVKN